MTLIEPNTTAAITAGDPTSKALRLQVAWQTDRFTAEIFLVQSGREKLLFQSSSEDQSTDWPKHPPLQQASIEEINNRPTLLGIGLAGTSHWSVSVETADEPVPAIQFDYACKHRGEIGFLGSRYRIADGVDSKTDAFAGILLEVDGVHIQLAPGDENSLATLSREEQFWEVHPEAYDDPARWKYQISLM